jgi:hypothetical protein
MRLFLSVLSLAVILSLNCAAELPAAESQWVYITEEWVARHPERLQVFGGTAVSGLNNYGFQLKTDGAYRWRIVTKLFPKKSKDAAALYETVSRTGDVTDTVEVGYVENAPYAFDVAFHIERVPPESPDAEFTAREYVIKLADWDRLLDATRRSK